MEFYYQEIIFILVCEYIHAYIDMAAKTKLVVSTKDFSSPDTSAVDRLDAIYQLADYCIDLLQQNEEHHGEVREYTRYMLYLSLSYLAFCSHFTFSLSQALEWFSTLMVEHTELFWSLFTFDLDAALDVQPPDTWDSFSLFQLLNDYFNKERK